MKNLKELKKIINEGKQLYTIYSDANNQNIKIISIEKITVDMNNDSLINVTLGNGVKCCLHYWEFR